MSLVPAHLRCGMPTGPVSLRHMPSFRWAIKSGMVLNDHLNVFSTMVGMIKSN